MGHFPVRKLLVIPRGQRYRWTAEFSDGNFVVIVFGIFKGNHIWLDYYIDGKSMEIPYQRRFFWRKSPTHACLIPGGSFITVCAWVCHPKMGCINGFKPSQSYPFEIGEPSCQARTSEPPVDEQKGSIWFTNIWARFCRSLPVRQELYSSWVDLGLQKSSNAIQTPGIIMSVGDFLSHYIHCYIHDHTCIHAHNRTYIQTYSFTLSMPIYGGLSIDMLNCCGLNCWDSSLETSIPTPQNMIPRRWCSLGLSWFIEAPNWNNYT